MTEGVAITGVGTTGFTRRSSRSRRSMAVEAAIAAIEDAGLAKADVDGVCGTNPDAPTLAVDLGLDRLSYFGNQVPPIGFSLLDGARAVRDGTCRHVLVVHSVSRPAAADDPIGLASEPGGALPLRLVPGQRPSFAFPVAGPDEIKAGLSYPAWASRYYDESGLKPPGFAVVARNARCGAADNPLAVLRRPLSVEEYEASRPVAWPLVLADYEIAAEGADAFVLSAGSAAGDRHRPVVVDQGCAFLLPRAGDILLASLRRTAMHEVGRALRPGLDDGVDVLCLYDGFSVLVPLWLEALGLAGFGEGVPFLERQADATGRVLVGGAVPVNPHGGSLAEGASQGSGHVREAVLQLRGSAGDRQVQGAERALVAVGGPFFNSIGLMLRGG